jgi:hypothetical protein
MLLQDTGTSLDICPNKFVKPEHYTKRTVLIKQPLENHFRRLRVAKISLDSEKFGKIYTEAAVADSSVKLNYYIMGNLTRNLSKKEFCKSTNSVNRGRKTRDGTVRKQRYQVREKPEVDRSNGQVTGEKKGFNGRHENETRRGSNKNYRTRIWYGKNADQT